MKKRINQINLPLFKDTNIVRWALLFQGKVKRVAFRNEALLLANRLTLSGYVKNIKTGVFIEVEGPLDKLEYFLSHLLSVERFIISSYQKDDINIVYDERFIIK